MTVARSVVRAVASPVARAVDGGIGGVLHTYFTDNNFDDGAGNVGNDAFDTTTGHIVTYNQPGFWPESKAALVIVDSTTTASKKYRDETPQGSNVGWAGIRFYAKAVGGDVDRVLVQETGGGVMACSFTFAGEVTAGLGARPATWADMRHVGDGWYECRAARDTSVAPATFRPSIVPWNNDWGAPNQTSHANAGDDTYGVLIDRPQFVKNKSSLAEVQSILGDGPPTV